MQLPDKFSIIIPPQDIACDPGLPAKLANGDKLAFAWLYKNYCKKVYDYAMLMTNDNHISEDVVQDVFLRLWNNRDKLNTIENFNGYFYMLYRNVVLDMLKTQKREITVRQVYYYDTARPVMMPDEMITIKERTHAIANVVKQMPQQRRMVYSLREVGWDRKKIAKELKIQPNTVKAHTQKALQFIRGKILNS